jgi:hypothetical protein
MGGPSKGKPNGRCPGLLRQPIRHPRAEQGLDRTHHDDCHGSNKHIAGRPRDGHRRTRIARSHHPKAERSCSTPFRQSNRSRVTITTERIGPGFCYQNNPVNSGEDRLTAAHNREAAPQHRKRRQARGLRRGEFEQLCGNRSVPVDDQNEVLVLEDGHRKQRTDAQGDHGARDVDGDRQRDLDAGRPPRPQ